MRRLVGSCAIVVALIIVFVTFVFAGPNGIEILSDRFDAVVTFDLVANDKVDVSDAIFGLMNDGLVSALSVEAMNVGGVANDSSCSSIGGLYVIVVAAASVVVIVGMVV